jgi:hypothetical protein
MGFTAQSGAPSTTNIWPADYFIDAEGRNPRYDFFGEGDYALSEKVILSRRTRPHRFIPSRGNERRRRRRYRISGAISLISTSVDCSIA